MLSAVCRSELHRLGLCIVRLLYSRLLYSRPIRLAGNLVGLALRPRRVEAPAPADQDDRLVSLGMRFGGMLVSVKLLLLEARQVVSRIQDTAVWCRVAMGESNCYQTMWLGIRKCCCASHLSECVCGVEPKHLVDYSRPVEQHSVHGADGCGKLAESMLTNMCRCLWVWEQWRAVELWR